MAWKPSSLSENEERLWRLVEAAPAPGKHAARNALFHVERAYALQETDPEMAVFRSITGEEEAIRAIFESLRRRGYPNARRLDWQDHRQKAAVVPFLRAVADLIAKAGFVEPRLGFEKHDGQDVLRFRIKVPNPLGSGFVWLYPDPPLDFGLEIDGKKHDFRPEIDALLAAASVTEFTKFVRARANERNRLLYATTEGLPRVIGDVTKVLDATRGRVFAELTVFVLIDVVKTHQQFVVQALDAFVRLMALIPDDAGF